MLPCSSNFCVNLGDRSHSFPSSVNASQVLVFFFNIFNACAFPFPANAHRVSHPVNACMPRSPLHTSGPSEAATFFFVHNFCPCTRSRFREQGSSYLIAKHQRRDKYISVLQTDKNRVKGLMSCMGSMEQ